MQLKKLIVKNFKSLRDCEIELGKFNVLIGANASGKTNLIEVFKLLRKIYVEKDTNPFLEWWGYNNVVWAGKEELPITVGMLFDVDGYEVYFETTFTGTGGSFGILREVLDVKEYVKLDKNGAHLSVEYSPEFYRVISEIPSVLFKGVLSSIERKMDIEAPTNKSLLQILTPEGPEEVFLQRILSEMLGTVLLVGAKFVNSGKEAFIVSPRLGEHLFIGKFLEEFSKFLNPLLIGKLNMQNLKTPQLPRKETLLKEDASNLISLLYNIWLREGKLPEELSEPLSIAFPDTRVFFQLTEDGRVMMKVFEGELELAPPGISDGFYKTLAILTAAYLKPPLLIIDEIENSLHPETLELLLDTLKESESQVIITTHSPVVVDMTDPSDVIFVEKIHGETEFKRIPNPEEIKKMLQEKGLAFSEGWLYGEIFKE